MNLPSAALALALLAGPAAAQNKGEAVTLAEAVAAAVQNSPAALAAEQDVIIARQRVHEARFLALPQLTLSAAASSADLEYPAVQGTELGERFLDPAVSDTFYTLRAQALQPLYTGGRNTNTLKLAKTAHSQAKVAYEAARADAALAAKKAFYALLYQQRLRDSYSYWLARARSLSASLGGGSFEELEAAMLLSGLEDRVRRSDGDLEAARTELVKVMNREPGFFPVPAGAFEARGVAADASSSMVTAMESRPELKSELYKAQMDDISVSLAMTRRNPTIYLGASYDLNAYRLSDIGDRSARANNWLASLAVKLPLSYDIWTQVRQRRAQQRQGELKRSGLQDRMRFEIVAAHKEAAARQEEADLLGAESRSMTEAFEAALRSAKPSPAALRALCALSDLERRRLDAVYFQLLARVKLEWARGRDLE